MNGEPASEEHVKFTAKAASKAKSKTSSSRTSEEAKALKSGKTNSVFAGEEFF